MCPRSNIEGALFCLVLAAAILWLMGWLDRSLPPEPKEPNE